MKCKKLQPRRQFFADFQTGYRSYRHLPVFLHTWWGNPLPLTQNKMVDGVEDGAEVGAEWILHFGPIQLHQTDPEILESAEKQYFLTHFTVTFMYLLQEMDLLSKSMHFWVPLSSLSGAGGTRGDAAWRRGICSAQSPRAGAQGNFPQLAASDCPLNTLGLFQTKYKIRKGSVFYGLQDPDPYTSIRYRVPYRFTVGKNWIRLQL